MSKVIRIDDDCFNRMEQIGKAMNLNSFNELIIKMLETFTSVDKKAETFLSYTCGYVKETVEKLSTVHEKYVETISSLKNVSLALEQFGQVNDEVKKSIILEYLNAVKKEFAVNLEEQEKEKAKVMALEKTPENFDSIFEVRFPLDQYGAFPPMQDVIDFYRDYFPDTWKEEICNRSYGKFAKDWFEHPERYPQLDLS